MGAGRILGLLLFVPRAAVPLDCEKPAGFEGDFRPDRRGLGREFERHCPRLRAALPAVAQKPYQRARPCRQRSDRVSLQFVYRPCGSRTAGGAARCAADRRADWRERAFEQHGCRVADGAPQRARLFAGAGAQPAGHRHHLGLDRQSARVFNARLAGAHRHPGRRRVSGVGLDGSGCRPATERAGA